MRTTVRAVLRRLILSLAASAVAAGLAETTLRILYFQHSAGERLALVHYFGALRERTAARWKQSVGIWQWDGELGYDHRPNSSGIHRSARGDFRVRYTIDDLRCRITPTPPAPRGELLLLGDSVTFGFGVEDREAYPSLLGERHWPDMKIRNRSVQGWGTTHAFIALRRWLDERPAPDLAVYAMIPHHVQRNYLRASWLDEVLTWCPPGERRGHPHFELSGGQPRFLGVVGREAGLPDSPDLRRTEVALTAALLVAMNDLARSRGVGFAVILLPGPGPDYPPAVVQALMTSHVPVLDLTQLDIPAFAHDPHFTAAGHAKIAEAIAESFIRDLTHRGIAGKAVPREALRSGLAGSPPAAPGDSLTSPYWLGRIHRG